MEHSQTPKPGIQSFCRLNIGGGKKWTNCQSDGTRFLPPTRCKNGVEQSESTKLPPQEKATTQRTVGGKFFDSTDGKCSTVSAQDYDEQIEREVAENIIDWWVSKKSYKQWYADKFLQHTLDFGQ